jgi:hypothetical protein
MALAAEHSADQFTNFGFVIYDQNRRHVTDCNSLFDISPKDGLFSGKLRFSFDFEVGKLVRIQHGPATVSAEDWQG